MYDRFSPDAREAMRLANQEAMRLGHEYIAPADILLGIARLENVSKNSVLPSLRESINLIRSAVNEIYAESPSIGEEHVPQMPRAKRVVEEAIEQSRTLGHDYVGSEHILLGLLCTEDPVVSGALARSGLKAATLRENVVRDLQNRSD